MEGGAELQQDPQIGQFLIKEKLNKRKTHKVRKLLRCFSSAAKRNPFNESEKGQVRVGTGTGRGQLHLSLELLHFFSFFFFSVMPRIIRSSRKMSTKSRKRSTQCQM